MAEQDQPEQAETEPGAAHVRDPVVQAANRIARTLGETQRVPWAQIRRIVEALGPEPALALVAEVHALEAAGGMLVPDGHRRRTPGGVYFVLARERLTPEQREVVFPPVDWKALHQAQRARRAAARAEGGAAPSPAAPAAPVLPALIWAERGILARELRAEQGEAKVKVTLLGRPRKIITKADCVITVMASMQAPSLPKGVPVPPATPTTYTIYIARKQFEKVAQALQANAEDKLIVEGFAAYDPELEGVGVYATSVTTVATQAAKRQAQQP
jgi:hypothetical protein